MSADVAGNCSATDALCKRMWQDVRNRMPKGKQKCDVPASAQLLPMVFGFMTSQAISVAAKLGVADLLATGSKTADELAQKMGVKPRPLYRLLPPLPPPTEFRRKSLRDNDCGPFALTRCRSDVRRDDKDNIIVVGSNVRESPFSVEKDRKILLNSDLHA